MERHCKEYSIHASAKWVGLGAPAKSSSQLPVQVSNGTSEFILHSPFAKSSVDFAVFYALVGEPATADLSRYPEERPKSLAEGSGRALGR